MINIDDIKGDIDDIIGGSHPYFTQEKYNDFVTYKIVISKDSRFVGLYDINAYITDAKRKGGVVNLLLLDRYVNIPADSVLELVKTYQHNGVWDGDNFVITGDIERNK